MLLRNCRESLTPLLLFVHFDLRLPSRLFTSCLTAANVRPLASREPTALRLLHHPVTFLHECRQLTREGNPPAPLPVDNLAHVKAQPLYF
jgi:hypothetical protein